MRRACVIELSAEEHTELQRTARSSRSSVREVFRARIVLLAAEGQENRAIAEQLDTRPIPCRNGGGASPSNAWRASSTDRDADENLTSGEKSSNVSWMTPCIARPSRPRIGLPAPWPGTRV